MSHLDSDEVNALRSGTLAENRLVHLGTCDDCAAHLDDVAVALGDLPAPPMPVEVSSRLAAVVAAESRRRTSGQAEAEERAQQAAHAKRLSLGSFGDNSPHTELGGKVIRPATGQRVGRTSRSR